uniref:Patellin-3-like n=1 Tax=Davidia involucrata TaxID=16924 RepID=A0A5B7BPL1_DAVIN
MAEETQKTAPEAPATAEVVVVSDVPVAEKSTTGKEPPSAPEPEPEAALEEVAEAEKPKAAAEEEKITESASFKEETNVVGELPDPQKKALDELKLLIQEALNKHEFTAPPPPPPAKEEEKPAEEEKPTAAAEEESKPVEKPEVPAEAPPADAPPPAAEETPKPEAEVVAPPVETKEEEKTPPPPEAETSEAVSVTVVEVVEKVTAVDDDGAKTVEAIKETIVEVSASAPPPEEPAPAEEAAPPAEPKEEAESLAPPPPPPEEVSIWGIQLLADEKSDVILLKFLRARDFKVKEAFTMIKNTVRWQKEFGIESLIEEELGTELEKVVFMHGFDKEGHPVCYNAYGEFQNKELYQNTFADEEKRQKFLKWRIQFLEKSIRKLDFSPDGICTIVQVNDLKNSPGLFMRELRQATNQALQLLQDNYPEFVAKQVFINVPWWYLAFYRMISPFFTQRTKSKFVFAGPSKSAETLFKYIAPEQVPVQYGGLSREGEQEFTTADCVTEETIKPATKHTVEFPMSETCHLVWEVRVVGWDVCYGTEFVPSTEDGYTVIVQKSRKITPADEPIICNSFKMGEPGKVVLTFDNQTSKKKKLLYRSKTKPSE